MPLTDVAIRNAQLCEKPHKVTGAIVNCCPRLSLREAIDCRSSGLMEHSQKTG
jgi:hypothetical protein